VSGSNDGGAGDNADDSEGGCGCVCGDGGDVDCVVDVVWVAVEVVKLA
jgi:hypothetical protein